MTPEQQRIAIAEACGWVYQPEHDVPFNTPAGNVFPESWRKETDDEDITACEAGLPNYLHDLNAMHEAERSLKGEHWRDYINNLIYVVDGGPPKEHMFMIYTATAAQRAEAFLRTLGKWTND